jgi:hypothetical protein
VYLLERGEEEEEEVARFSAILSQVLYAESIFVEVFGQSYSEMVDVKVRLEESGKTVSLDEEFDIDEERCVDDGGEGWRYQQRGHDRGFYTRLPGG